MLNFTEEQMNQVIQEQPRMMLVFYGQIKPVLGRYFKTRVHSPDDQEDLIQDTILSVLDSLPQFKKESTFSTWLLSIAHHELVDYYRRKKIKAIVFSKLPFLKDIIDKALGPQLALEEKEAKHKLFQTFKYLSEGNAHILRLRYMEGLTVTAIAKQLNITYKAAESKLSRARVAFQKEFVRNRPLVPAFYQVQHSS